MYKILILIKMWGQPDMIGAKYGGGYTTSLEGESIDVLIDKLNAYSKEHNIFQFTRTSDGNRLMPSSQILLENRDKVYHEISDIVSRDVVYFIGYENYPGPQPVNLASVRGAELPAININTFHCSCGTTKSPRKNGMAIRKFQEMILLFATNGYTCPYCGNEWRGVNVSLQTFRLWIKSRPEISWDNLMENGGIIIK